MMATRTVIDLSQTPIIKGLVERLAAFTGRFAPIESNQALILAQLRGSRGVASSKIIDGYLVVTYASGEADIAGPVIPGTPPIPDTVNTLGGSLLPSSGVADLTSALADADARLTALGY